MRKVLLVLLALLLALECQAALAEEADTRLYINFADLSIDMDTLLAEIPTTESLGVDEKGYGRTYSFDSSFAENAKVTFDMDGTLYCVQFFNLGSNDYAFDEMRFYGDEFQGSYGEYNVFYDAAGMLISYAYKTREGAFVNFGPDNTLWGVSGGETDMTQEEQQALALKLIGTSNNSNNETVISDGRRVYANLDLTGVDPAICLASMPEYLTKENDVITLPDHGYTSVALFMNNDVVGTLSGGVWTLDCTGVQLDDQTFVIADTMNEHGYYLSCMWYAVDGELFSITAEDPHGEGSMGNGFAFLDVTFTDGDISTYEVGDYNINAKYNANGQLTEYYYFTDSSVAFFDAQNTLIRVAGIDNPDPAEYPSAEIIYE